MALRRSFLSATDSDNFTDCAHDCSFHPLPPPFNAPLSSGDYKSDRRLPASIIIACVCVVSAVVLLFLMYYTIFIRRVEVLSSFGNTGASDSEDGESDYPLRHIRTVGLHESVINSITAKPCIAGAGAAADCSVCLNNLREGELVRFLPACGHCFHVPCIDTWLRAHISCPICRSNIFDPVSVLLSSEVGEVGSIDAERNVLTSDQRVSEELEEDGGVAITDITGDCIERSTPRDRGDLPGNVLRREWRSNSMVSSLASHLSFRIDRAERSEDVGNLNRDKQGSSLRFDRFHKNQELG